MKAKILGFFCSLLIINFAYGQTIDGVLYTNFNNYYKWKGGAFDSTFLLPQTSATNGKRAGALRYAAADSSVYSWSGTQWIKLGGASGDTATVVKAYVTNAEAVTITKGQVVYIFGAQGDRASVKLAKNTSDTFSSKTLGIVRANIAAGQAGWITTQGQVSGINLSAYNPGDILWLDSVAGGFTKNKPQAPKHSVFVGVVERANAGNGLIYVKPQNGVPLSELHDVRITSISNNEIIRYNSSLGYWENKSITTTLGYTPLNVTDTASLSNRINLKLNISDTAAMLTPYLKKADTSNFYSLMNRMDDKLEFVNEFYFIDNFLQSGAHNFQGNTTANRFNFGYAQATATAVNDTRLLYTNFNSNSGLFFPSEITGNPYNFQTRVKVDTCTSGDTLYFYTGLGLVNALTNTSYGTSGSYFVYDPRNTLGQGSSGFIQCVTMSNTTRTTTVTSKLFSPSTFTKLRMQVTSSEIKFYIDNDLVATHTTNLPTATSLGYSWMYRLFKTVGSTARNAIYDYWMVEHYFDTNR
jgi:hypothetical protein